MNIGEAVELRPGKTINITPRQRAVKMTTERIEEEIAEKTNTKNTTLKTKEAMV
jgi:hypothetical protein